MRSASLRFAGCASAVTIAVAWTSSCIRPETMRDGSYSGPVCGPMVAQCPAGTVPAAQPDRPSPTDSANERCLRDDTTWDRGGIDSAEARKRACAKPRTPPKGKMP